MSDIFGTAGADNITGTSGNDHIQGLAGMDSLDGGAGDDLVEGGADDDYIYARSGSDIVDGGDGDDRLYVMNYDSATATIQLAGGAGADIVTIHSSGPHQIFVDTGTGDDEVSIGLVANGSSAQITLGPGQDTLRLYPFGAPGLLYTPNVLRVTDFETGAAGDRLDWLDFLGSTLSGWNGAANPFATGHLRLVQSGADTLLQIDRDATGASYSFETLISFANTSATAFTWQNLDGFNGDGTIPAGQILNGTAGDDWLDGAAGADTLNGFAGNNRMWGGSGDDVILGGDGYDEMYGEFGNDRLRAAAATTCWMAARAMTGSMAAPTATISTTRTATTCSTAATATTVSTSSAAAFTPTA